jgi:glycosyltransferase involved in cell wall biosynthesis
MPVWAKARMAAAPDTLRVVAFEDTTYHREAGTVYADRAFLTFMAGLHGEFGRLVVLGRLAPEPGRSHYPLPREVEFVALPHYPDLLHPLPVASALVRAARRVWSVLGDADAAFILGPTPMSVLIAWIALLRRKRVVLGIRQNTTQYIRNRHPTRRLIHLGADLLELVWRTMTRRWCPVAVVGTEVAERYAVARSRHDLHVSLVHERDLASPEVAAARTYDGDIRVLSVGRLDVEKNPLMLADVLAALRAGGGRHRLVVCGDGPLHAELAERLQALGGAEHAERRGDVPVDAQREH